MSGYRKGEAVYLKAVESAQVARDNFGLARFRQAPIQQHPFQIRHGYLRHQQGFRASKSQRLQGALFHPQLKTVQIIKQPRLSREILQRQRTHAPRYGRFRYAPGYRSSHGP